jgi:dUTP pyrophosphatase
MAKKFLLKIVDDINDELYENHNTYHKGDAGLDLFITQDHTIHPNETVLVDMGVRCQSRSIDPCVWNWLRGNFYKYHSYLLLPRSSISKTNLRLANNVGIIDAGYRGHLIGMFDVINANVIETKKFDRYLQICAPGLIPIVVELVESLDELGEQTSRGDGAFGSTGR